jgi:hypothetical protein
MFVFLLYFILNNGYEDLSGFFRETNENAPTINFICFSAFMSVLGIVHNLNCLNLDENLIVEMIKFLQIIT